MIFIKKNNRYLYILIVMLISFFIGYLIPNRTSFEIKIEGIYNKTIKDTNNKYEIDQILNIYIKNPIILNSSDAYKATNNNNPDITLKIKRYSLNIFSKSSYELLTSYIWFLANGEAIISIPSSDKEYNLLSESDRLNIEWRKISKTDVAAILKPIFESD